MKELQAASTVGPSRWRTSPAHVLLHWLGSRIEAGTLVIEMPEGDTLEFIGSQCEQPVVRWKLHNFRPIWALITRGTTGFAESYLDGDWTTPCLTSLLRFAATNEARFGPAVRGSVAMRVIDRVRHRLRANSPGQAKRNIAHHYDLGNDFYACWLDSTMTYSAAMFETEETPLDVAQFRKYERLARALAIEPGDRVLEIGCGWGGFMAHAARRYDATVTGVSLSNEQVSFARQRLKDAGVADRTTVEFRDYREIAGQFDKIVSIEMFEAVGEAYWSTYAAKMKQLLRPGGSAALQIITIDEAYFDSYRTNPDFIQKYIFPGGMLPSLRAVEDTFRMAGLAIVDRLNFGLDYARTLDHWRRRFDARWPEIRELGFDERFQRMWHYYLAYCEAGFRQGTIDVVQVRLEHA